MANPKGPRGRFEEHIGTLATDTILYWSQGNPHSRHHQSNGAFLKEFYGNQVILRFLGLDSVFTDYETPRSYKEERDEVKRTSDVRRRVLDFQDDDLERTILDGLLRRGDKYGNNKRFEDMDHGLHTYFLKAPLRNSSLIEYIQQGVKELLGDKKLQNKVIDFFDTRPSHPNNRREVFSRGSGHPYYPILAQFSYYMDSVRTLMEVIRGGKSILMKDCYAVLETALQNESFKNAVYISQKENHTFEITQTGIDDKKVVTDVRYVLDSGERIHCFNHDDNSHDFNEYYYRPVVNAIQTVLEGEGHELFDGISFARSLLKYVFDLARFTKEEYEDKGIPYCFPEILPEEQKELTFRNALHPFLLGKDNPTPNDVELHKNKTGYIMAGANDSGKTTYITMIGLLTIMAQMGAPTPCESARVSPVDNIYTHFSKPGRVSSGQGKHSDDLARLAYIFENVTENSLVLLDEPIGGTAENDAIRSSLEVISGLDSIGCLTGYTTHYHDIQRKIPSGSFVNLRMVTDGSMDTPVFTHRFEEGIAGTSHGYELAQQKLPIQEILKRRGFK